MDRRFFMKIAASVLATGVPEKAIAQKKPDEVLDLSFLQLDTKNGQMIAARSVLNGGWNIDFDYKVTQEEINENGGETANPQNSARLFYGVIQKIISFS